MTVATLMVLMPYNGNHILCLGKNTKPSSVVFHVFWVCQKGETMGRNDNGCKIVPLLKMSNFGSGRGHLSTRGQEGDTL